MKLRMDPFQTKKKRKTLKIWSDRFYLKRKTNKQFIFMEIQRSVFNLMRGKNSSCLFVCRLLERKTIRKVRKEKEKAVTENIL